MDPNRTDELAKILAASGRRGRRWRFVAIGFALAAMATAGFFAWKWFGSGQGQSNQDMNFETVEVIRGDLASTISATGTVQALNTVEVGAEISGRISSIHADFNTPVAQGALLAEIDPEQLEAAVGQAKAQVLAARAGVAEAEALLVESRQEKERAAALADKGLLSDRELQAAVAKASRAEATILSARAQLALARASFEQAESRLNKTRIVAPSSGTVLSRKVEVGQTINAGMQTPVLFVIAEDLRRMELSARVDESDIGAVVAGQKSSFTVDAYPDRKFSSEVTSVRNVPLTDQGVVSYEVLLSVDNDDLFLRPGMTATVEIVTSIQQQVLLVPNKALRFTPPRTDARRGPPIGMPMLGSRSKGSSGKVNDETMGRLGKLDSREGILWLPGSPEPRPIKVHRLATDGTNTAVRGDEMKEGLQIIVDLAAVARTSP